MQCTKVEVRYLTFWSNSQISTQTGICAGLMYNIEENYDKRNQINEQSVIVHILVRLNRQI